VDGRTVVVVDEQTSSVKPGKRKSCAKKLATATICPRLSKIVLRPELVSFSIISKTAAFHWKRLASNVPKRRTPALLSENTNPRKSLVNPWIPARTETKS
jgi:hypothetical protein